MCSFVKAWQGKCDGPDPCEMHAGLKCCVCESPATHDCDETCGLVCGAMLCDDCEHEIHEDGTNRGGGHCKKDDQKFTPWYVR